MDYQRELNKVQKDLETAFSKIESTNLSVVELQATHREQYNKIVSTLEQLNKDMQTLSAAVKTLESLATQGRTSLKTLLWVGGFIAAFATFIFNITGFWFGK